MNFSIRLIFLYAIIAHLAFITLVHNCMCIL